jgi:hypothetical protein
MSKRKPRIPLNELQRKIVASISAVTFLPGCGDKRFYRSIKDDLWLTEGQINYLYKIFDKYRRQIRDYELLAMELEPERFKVDLRFQTTLFGTEANISVKDTYTPKDRWTKRDRQANS